MASVIQIFGTVKCRETQKAVRFFKERGVKTQFVNLAEKGMSRGELESVLRGRTPEELIDTEGKEYKRLNLAYIIHDITEKLLESPLLLKTPVTRYGQKSEIGYQPDEWKKWIAEFEKG
ncbi:MAG: arsenate reductase family protein [Chloroflexota bacterium]